MGENPNLVEQAAKEMDEALAGVMPDSWMGHARLVIAGTPGLSEKQESFALKLSERLIEKKGVSAEKAAELSVEKAEEKLA